MTEHLPECWAKHDSDPPAWCICDELRACEARVQKIAYQQGLGAGSDEHRQHEIGWIKGYDAALDAAVKRVEELTIPHHFPVAVTSAVWNQVIGECIAAIKGDQP